MLSLYSANMSGFAPLLIAKEPSRCHPLKTSCVTIRSTWGAAIMVLEGEGGGDRSLSDSSMSLLLEPASCGIGMTAQLLAQYQLPSPIKTEYRSSWLRSVWFCLDLIQLNATSSCHLRALQGSCAPFWIIQKKRKWGVRRGVIQVLIIDASRTNYWCFKY